MVVLLVDLNLDGHAELLAMRLSTDAWREFRDELDIRFPHFEQVGLDRAAADDVVWRLCRAKGYYLLTANRNSETEDSLEVTIRSEGTGQSLPVFTFADADRVFRTAAYLDRVVESLITYPMAADIYRGAGRLFVP